MSTALLIYIGGGASTLLGLFLFLRLRRDDSGFRRRLRRAAGPLTGRDDGGAAAEEVDIFRTEGGRRAGRLRRMLEARYPLLDVGRTLPRALLLGIAAAAGSWIGMRFLVIPTGWWTWPIVALAGAGAAWYAFSWSQKRLATEFGNQFPEIIDQIVRLSGAGVPPIEAIAVVAEDARPPVQPVLKSVSDGLTAGLDADTALATVSQRVRLPEFALFAAVLQLQRRAGGGVSAAFANLADALREQRNTAMKAHAATGQTRLTLLVLSVLPPVVLTAQSFISPHSVHILFNTPEGASLLHWGVGLAVAGLLAARAMGATVEK